jgi:hypothetical protein
MTRGYLPPGYGFGSKITASANEFLVNEIPSTGALGGVAVHATA